MMSVHCLKHLAVVLIAVLLPCEVQAQKPFDPAKISGLRSTATPPANPPPIPAWEPAFAQQLERCWKKPYGGADVPRVQAEFAIRLKSDGTLDGPPIASAFNGPMTPYYQAYQESARRALIECQPYHLPADQFDQWKYFTPVFAEKKNSAQSHPASDPH
jgi:hypothetical protein